MNKKLFLKSGFLILVLSSLAFVACEQKNTSTAMMDSSKSNNLKPFNNDDKSTKTSEDINPSIPKDIVNSKSENTQQNTTEEHYYKLIKESWQNQKNYINSINDPKVKQSLQTPSSAAISKSTELISKHPEDSKIIDISLKKVLNNEN